MAWLKAMAWDLRTNIEDETSRAVIAPDFTATQIDELYPGYPFADNPVIVPSLVAAQPASATTNQGTTATASVQWSEVDGVIEAVSALVGDAGEGIGSNSWVVSGDLTESGMPLLANDPHLGAALPSVWHQIGLRCRAVTESCPFDVAGFSFSGLPGIVIGHNDRVAWGFTNLTTDVTDLYLEKIEGDQYWRDGQLVPLQERTEVIEVAGSEDVELRIRATENGPILSDLTDDFSAIAADPFTGTGGSVEPPANAPEGEYAVSLKWTALEPGTTASAIFALDLAQDFEDFFRAAGSSTSPRRICCTPTSRATSAIRRRSPADPGRRRRLDAAAGLGFGVRVAGLHPVRRAAHRVQPGGGLHRDGEQRDRR